MQALFSLSLSFYDLLSKFGSRRSLIRWVYSYTSREDLQSMYEPDGCFVPNLCGHYFMLLGYLSHATKAQTSLRKCAFPIQIPASTQCRATICRQRNAIQMAVRWRADCGPLLDVYLDKVGSIDSSHHRLYVFTPQPTDQKV